MRWSALSFDFTPAPEETHLIFRYDHGTLQALREFASCLFSSLTEEAVAK